MTKKPKPKAQKKNASAECIIPPAIPPSALPGLVLPRNDGEVQRIAEYVEWQSRAEGEIVVHAEKISEEYVYLLNPGINRIWLGRLPLS